MKGRGQLTILFLLNLVGVFILSSVAAADEASFQYQKGNEFYTRGNYAAAIDAYRQALQFNRRHPDLYYNLGNAYFKSGDLGRAMLSYLRAERLSPRDPDIRANIKFLRDRLPDKVDDKHSGFLGLIMSRLVDWLSLNEWINLALVFWVMVLTALFLLILRPQTRARTAIISVLISCGAALIITLPFAFSRYWSDRLEVYAVAVAPEIKAHSAPAADKDVVFTFHAGLALKIRQTQEGWHLIILPNGLTGWIPQETVEPL